ncbi:MAG: efflux RND transporter periplasmic adaptor subunit [Pseudomonadota bacterium]
MANRARRGIITFVAVFAALVVIVYLLKERSNAEKLASAPPPGAQYVVFSKVTQQEWGTLIEAVGTVQSFSGITLRAQISGRVTAVHVESGAQVRAGEALFEINPEVIQAQLDQHEAELKSSKFNFERMQELFAQGTVSQQAMVEARSNFFADQAKVRTSQQQLELATTYATIDGTVGITKVKVGDEVAVNQELATLQSSERLRVEFAIPQKYASLVSPQDSVSVATSPDSTRPVDAIIYAVSPLIEPDTRTVAIRAEVPPHRFLPGSYVHVTLTLDDAAPVLTVPQTAVVRSLYGDSVYKVVNGKAVKTGVVIGERRGGDVEVTGTLAAGDAIVGAGTRKVADGTPVVDGKAPDAKQTADGQAASQSQ